MSTEAPRGPFHVHPAVGVGLFLLGFGAHAVLFPRRPATAPRPTTTSVSAAHAAQGTHPTEIAPSVVGAPVVGPGQTLPANEPSGDAAVPPPPVIPRTDGAVVPTFPAGDAAAFVRTAVDLAGPAGAQIAQALAAAPHGSPGWFVLPPSNPGSAARAEQLGAIFARSGWQVHPTTFSPAVTAPGVSIFAAPQAPSYVHLVAGVLRTVGMTNMFVTDYRGNCEAATRDGGGGCVLLDPGQTYVIAVGPGS